MDNGAYIISQAVCALIEMQSMITANKVSEKFGRPVAYHEQDFMTLIDKYGIGTNAALLWLRQDND